MTKSKIELTVKKTFDACKSAGARKIQFRAAESYSCMSERQTLKITNNNIKYNQFKTKFTNKAILDYIKGNGKASGHKLRNTTVNIIVISCHGWIFSAGFNGLFHCKEIFLLMWLFIEIEYLWSFGLAT